MGANADGLQSLQSAIDRAQPQIRGTTGRAIDLESHTSGTRTIQYNTVAIFNSIDAGTTPAVGVTPRAAALRSHS